MPLLSAPRLCACGHPVYDEEPRCPLCACQEHRPRLSAAGDHGAPTAVSPATGEGWKGAQPELPRAARYRFLRRHAAARNLCPRTLSASVVPAARCQRRPAVGRPRRTQPPCGPEPYPASGITPGPGIRPGCGRACPGLPSTPLSAACCRCRRAEPERRSEAPADGSAQRICRFELRAAVGTATRNHVAAVPRIPGRQLASLGRQRHRRIRHASAAYQQVSLYVTASAWGLRYVLRAATAKV